MQASFVRHLALAPRAVARHTRAGARLGGVRTFASASGSVASAPSSSSSGSGSWDSSKISWDVRVLYDGDCPLCVREVDFLRGKDGGAGRLDLVDIASDEYDPDANAGIPFETAMSTIHGIKPPGTSSPASRSSNGRTPPWASDGSTRSPRSRSYSTSRTRCTTSGRSDACRSRGAARWRKFWRFERDGWKPKRRAEPRRVPSTTEKRATPNSTKRLGYRFVCVLV